LAECAAAAKTGLARGRTIVTPSPSPSPPPPPRMPSPKPIAPPPRPPAQSPPPPPQTTPARDLAAALRAKEAARRAHVAKVQDDDMVATRAVWARFGREREARLAAEAAAKARASRKRAAESSPERMRGPKAWDHAAWEREHLPGAQRWRAHWEPEKWS